MSIHYEGNADLKILGYREPKEKYGVFKKDQEDISTVKELSLSKYKEDLMKFESPVGKSNIDA